MSELRVYRVFISHAWIYNDDYYRVVKMLDDAKYFYWRNYSVPEHDPLIIKTTGQLEKGLYNQIQPTHVVIIISGMYVSYRQWIQKEIEIAQEMGKPIIGIRPWGSERTPLSVQLIANEIVGWNTSSIVDAIKTWAI
ncbi:TIR domain-containing protein [Nostoc sphaeroides CHAB 2801]|uniref:TIR domain-containing protein n=1 Tax=Nostoc sphaeroides TaxID=446679 RepID=UPI001E4E920F|nr:TIR domain-containing protein [Nostoc sphaeroides]MCC5634168.1 TIR domain-containing protein [Nostoc sphaeroides CHAB 2801]